MPNIARSGDPCTTGHPCDVTTTIDTPVTGLSAGVNAEGAPIACLGDLLTIHMIKVGKYCVPHPAQVITSGSGTVFVGGVPVARVGDSCDIGGVITAGAGSVSAG